MTMTLLKPADADGGALALGSLKVAKGRIKDSRLLVAGSIGTILTCGMEDTDVYAGYVAADPAAVTGLPTTAQLSDAALFDALAAIRKVSVKGVKLPGRPYDDSFINSSIAGAKLGAVSLSYGLLDNGGVAFGLAGDSLGRLIYKDADVGRYTWPNSNPGEADAPRALGDLISRLV